jgi:hypothetical protein
VPKLWQKSRVVFIPKVGKDTYENPRSYRPISLTSFFFKTMERVNLWMLEQGALKNNPINSNQHAFRRGFSTDSAISAALHKIESYVYNKKYALVTFLDIKGAFDNVSIEAAVKGMRSKQFPENIIKWFSFYLANRVAEVNIKGVVSRKKLVKGTPQGGVLSPVIWNLIFDSFLQKVDGDEWVSGVGFADDGCLIVGGGSPRILRGRMQRMIDKTLKWGKEAALEFSPEKTKAMLMHRKHKPEEIGDLYMGQQKIEFVEKMKYLGIWLQYKLSWTDHIKIKADKTRKALFMVKAMAGTVWGPSNRMMKWCWSGIVRPGFTYGSIAFAQAMELEHNKKVVRKLNRLACLSVIGVRRGTPTAALEIMLGIMPLEVFIKGIVAKALLRVCRVNKIDPGEYDTFKGGHLNYARDKAVECGLLNLPLDEEVKRVSWFKPFKVEKFDKDAIPPYDQIVAYTDGSKGEFGHSGAGFVVYEGNKELVRFGEYRGKVSTVFQTEVYALGEAIKFMLNLPLTNKQMWLASDSQSAIQAITGHIIKSPLVRSVRERKN